MIPAVFDYHAPTSLEEALALLRQHGPDSKILSGGHSLLPMMKLRLVEPEHVIDINGIPGLSYVRMEGDVIKIGGLTREAEIERSDVIRSKVPIIYDTCVMIADPQVRNMGTMGGNLAHGDAGNDHPATMLALGARVVATGPNGTRTIDVDDFFVGFYTTALEPEEILTEIQVPVPPERSGGTYLKFERKVGDYATAGIAVQLTVDAKGRCVAAGIGLTNVAEVPLRATRAQDRLEGSELLDADIIEAAQFASEDARPSSDLRGSEAFKRGVIKTITQRAVGIAAERARKNQ